MILKALKINIICFAQHSLPIFIIIIKKIDILVTSDKET